MSIKTFFAGKGLKIFTTIIGVVLAGTAIFYFATKNKASGKTSFNPAFRAYISAYTGGMISKESTIQITFVSDIISEDKVNSQPDASLFDFSPHIKGTAVWTGKNSIQFTPNEPLPSGQSYSASFGIGDVIQMPEDLQKFEFSFQTIEQSFEVLVEGLSFYDVSNTELQKLAGTLSTSDVAENEEVEKILTAKQGGEELKINWFHDNTRTARRFEVENIKRTKDRGKVELSWNGAAIGSNIKGELSYDIPGIEEFILVESKAVQGEEQYAQLRFSDPISNEQDLEGLITIEDVPDLRILVEENVVKVYPPIRQIGTKKVTIFEGVKNMAGKRFHKTQAIEINFEEIKPAVKLSGKGVILPSTDGLSFPFQAVSLKSVRVRIIKIYETNVSQFLQVNRFDGDREIKRVGKLVLKKTIPLNNTNPSDYGKWKTYALDISSLVNTEPGAIYVVKLGFKKQDAYYACLKENENTSSTQIDLEEEDEEDGNFYEYENSYWDGADDYYSDDYDYNERENPCSDSYYGEYRTISQNIIASDLGIIAKLGASGNMVFAVTDLKTTLPVSDASVSLYDYQQQIILTEKTDGQGLIKIDSKKRPFLLVVKKDNQVGYLKLDNPSALSVSNFDVSGALVQKGIKGYLYGERGVWRPGDSLFLTFILEDKLKNLPDNTPVSFELTDPMGQVVKRMVSANGINEFYSFATTTNEADPTGTWQATVKVGGATFTHPLRIETIMPNRLKIKMGFGVDKIKASDNVLSGNLEVKWLHGAVAKNLNADISMQLYKSITKFSKYPDFVFDDPAKSFYSEEMEIYSGRINENGQAKISTRIDATSSAPGALMANFKVKVMEEGGAFSVDRFSLPYYPYKSLVGIKVPEGDQTRNMLLTDTTHLVNIATLDPDGKPLSGRKIEMQLFKLEWRWWWDNSTDELASYLENGYRAPLIKNSVVSTNGKATWKFRVNYPEWGRYYVRAYDVESGHSTGKVIYMDWPGWAGKSRERTQGGASLLTFTADKEKYNVGENVTLTIPGSAGGRALVSVESGSKILSAGWVEMKEGKTDYSFQVTDQMAPNVYVNVSLIQPHAQTKNDLPIRLYGIIPIKVENPATFLKPVITMKDELRPEENVSIKVSESSGKAMTYTLAVVDEGLLDLTRFQTPDPWNHFYAREALGVNTWDLYDYVIGASAEKISRLLSIGGDAELKKSEDSKAKRFEPVVKYFGPFKLDKGKSQTHTFKMPQYVGSVKTMVVAGNEDGAFGNAEKATPVRKPLMILATLPRVLGPEEFVALPVNVFAMTKNVKNVTVEVKTSGLLGITDGASKSISFAQPGDEVVNFYLKVKEGTGKAKVQVSAKSGSETATHEIEIEVRNPNTQVTRVIETLIQPNASWTTDYELFGVAGSNKATLEVSTIPPLNLGKRLQYLVSYPYGCVEQTTSSVFPQLFVMELVESSDEVAKRTESNIRAGIQRIKSFQLAEGALGYWPGADSYDSWSTTYAGHFMLEAQKKGYPLPESFLTLWKKFQKKTAKNWVNKGDYSDLHQAYRLYTLALAGDPELGAMNRLRESKNVSVAAKWRLAGAFHLAGKTDVAKSMVSGLTTAINGYKEMSNTFGSSLRDKAMILEVLSLLDMKVQATPIVKEISESLSGQSWLSTQETAFCLLAMTKYANTGLKNTKLDFDYAVNDDKTVRAVTDAKIGQIPMTIKQNSGGQVALKNNTAAPLYARVILTGIPKAGEEVASANNVQLSIIYTDKSGEKIDPTSLEQGTDFYAEVTVTNPGLRGNYNNMALRQIFPSGWEIHNVRLDNMPIAPPHRSTNYDDDEEYTDESESDVEILNNAPIQESKYSIPTYQDIRDDRVYTFFDLPARKTKTFRVALNAAYLGRFYLPAVYSEAMYDGTINATVPGEWVEVIQVGSDGLAINQ